MKKILIISDGTIGKHFITRTMQTNSSENIYYIVQTKENNFEDFNPARFKFYEFDPTSLYKLSNLLKMEFIQIFIAMDHAIDVENTIKNIRTMKKQLRIIVLNRWDLVNEDPNVVFINSNDILASRLLDYLPNVPVIAQNVGIGEGEIMEVLVPFGSSFVYKHIGVIEQKNWRLVAIYRNRKLLLPSRRRMIQPNDLLLLVGNPVVLKSVYKAIKQELGQFPEPFGYNLYLLIDMNIVSHSKVSELLKHTMQVHQKFNKFDLIIKVVNPSNIELLQEIKKYRSTNITIEIDYDSNDFSQIFHDDINAYHVGLVIVSKEMFADYKIRQNLYESQVPIFKLSNKELSSLKDTKLILSENRDLEKISSTIFDISEQMNLNIEMHNYMKEHQKDKTQVIEHFTNLSNIFSKSIKIIEDNDNPILALQKRDNFLQILPFTNKQTNRKIFSLFSTDSEKLYYKLDDYHQIFIPVQL
jgi:hypothetical protein